jgi:hypothetical protein
MRNAGPQLAAQFAQTEDLTQGHRHPRGLPSALEGVESTQVPRRPASPTGSEETCAVRGIRQGALSADVHPVGNNARLGLGGEHRVNIG